MLNRECRDHYFNKIKIGSFQWEKKLNVHGKDLSQKLA